MCIDLFGFSKALTATPMSLTAALAALAASVVKGEKVEWAFNAFLEHVGMTEFASGRWCQSGCQMGWGPDLDGDSPAIDTRDAHGNFGRVYVANDLYTPRVAAIVKGAEQAGLPCKVKTPPQDGDWSAGLDNDPSL